MFGLVLFVCSVTEDPTLDQCGVISNQNLFLSKGECLEEVGTGAQSFVDANGLYIKDFEYVYTDIFGKGANDA